MLRVCAFKVEYFTFFLFCFVLLGNLFSISEKSNRFLRWLQSLIAAYLRNTRKRDSYHPWPVTSVATTQFAREKGGCTMNKFL